MHPYSPLTSFTVNRQIEDETWERLFDFLAQHARLKNKRLTREDRNAVREMLYFDMPSFITDAHRIVRWISANGHNTISRFKLFREWSTDADDLPSGEVEP